MSKVDNSIDKALEVLQSKCIDAIEENFNLYLLNDLSEIGEVRELFNNEDWYLYYLETAWELNSIVNGLLANPDDNKSQLLKAISIKRVIDERLMFFSSNNLQMIFEDLNFNTNGVDRDIINLSNNLKNADSFLESLYNQLKQRNWIDSNIQDFKSNFLKIDYQVPINWVSKQTNIVGFIKWLVIHKYLELGDLKPAQLISRHFKDNGKKFKETSLGVVYSQMFTSNSLKEVEFNFIENCNKK